MLSALISRCVVIIFGVLHPAYKSYKALKLRDPKEHIKWMMHWIVFAFFYSAELVADTFLSWMPLYYEVKLVFIIWLICPITRGSSVLYRQIVHPLLDKKESEIDEALSRASEQGYQALTTYGVKGLNLAATTVVSTVIKGQGMLAEQLKQRSYSMNDLSSPNLGASDETDTFLGPYSPTEGDPTLPRQKYITSEIPVLSGSSTRPEIHRTHSELAGGSAHLRHTKPPRPNNRDIPNERSSSSSRSLFKVPEEPHQESMTPQGERIIYVTRRTGKTTS